MQRAMSALVRKGSGNGGGGGGRRRGGVVGGGHFGNIHLSLVKIELARALDAFLYGILVVVSFSFLLVNH